MKEQYSLGEQVEKEIKVDREREGREQAKFYRRFLENFKTMVLASLRTEYDKKYPRPEKNFDDMTLYDLSSSNRDIFNVNLQKAIDETNKVVSNQIKKVDLGGMDRVYMMKPIDFEDYIENLKSSLKE